MEKFTKEQVRAHVIAKLDRYSKSTFPVSMASLAQMEKQILEIALAALAAKPFMYGIEDCDGMAYFAEHCVSSNPAHLSDELQTADDESGEGAKVIPLYRLPEID
ncbi:hypothetical protein PBV95_001046 [Escherichia coli]|nr:hypothetical protein [Escherichia coli]